MGLKEKVYDLMKNPKGITVKEIAKELKTTEKAINSYIIRLRNDGKITDDNIIDKIYLDKTKGKKYYLYRVLAKTMNKKSSKSPIDTQILKKMIKPFTEYDIELDLEDIEINHIKELYEMIK